MSLVRKEDRSKIAKLLGAIVVVFGLAAVRAVGASNPSLPATPEAPVVPVASAAPPEGKIRVPEVTVPAGADPFRTIVPVRPPEPPRVEPVRAAPSLPVLTGPVPSVPIPVAEPSEPLRVAPLSTIPAQPPGPPLLAKATLRLTGVVAGPNAAAVVDSAGASTVVRVGTRLLDGTVVTRIDLTTVTLRRGAETRVLDVAE